MYDETSNTLANRAEDGEPLLDLGYARDLLQFVRHAVDRHRRRGIATFLLVAMVVGVTFALTPRMYSTQTKLFAQKNFVMPALNNPKRVIPVEGDDPTRLATEAVERRENLVAIIKQTNLLDDWRATRPLVLRWKDMVTEAIAGPRPELDRIDALVGMLERQLRITLEQGTVTIGITWPDATTAFRIVETAQRNFLEERHTTEVATIRESIGILENQVTEVHAAIDQAYADLKRDAPPVPTLSGPVQPPRPRRPTAAELEVSSLRATLAGKRLAIRDLEDFQRRRLAELEAKLAEQRNTYGPAHPVLAATQRSIADISADSPQLAGLRREERAVVAQIRQLGADENAVSAPEAPATGSMDQSLARAALASIDRARNDSVRSEREGYLRTHLQMSEREYEDLLQRLQGARIELETARAAFKYRYGVVSPAQITKKPVQPKAMLFAVGGLMLATMLAVLACVAIDVRSGRVLERWQVERVLGLKVVGEVPAR